MMSDMTRRCSSRYDPFMAWVLEELGLGGLYMCQCTIRRRTRVGWRTDPSHLVIRSVTPDNKMLIISQLILLKEDVWTASLLRLLNVLS